MHQVGTLPDRAEYPQSSNADEKADFPIHNVNDNLGKVWLQAIDGLT